MHKVVNRNAPQYFTELLPNTANATTNYNSRNKDDFDQVGLHIVQLRKENLYFLVVSDNVMK